MSWLQLHVVTDRASAESVEDALLEAGAVSVTMTDDADNPILEPGVGEMPLWEDVKITALFEADQDRHWVEQQLDLPGAHLSWEEVADQPWERAWMDQVVGSMGYVDALREVSREGDQFSWWPDTEQAEMLNLGYRFDYHLLTPGLRRCVRSARLPRQPRFSEHAPLVVDYDWTLSV